MLRSVGPWNAADEGIPLELPIDHMPGLARSSWLAAARYVSDGAGRLALQSFQLHQPARDARSLCRRGRRAPFPAGTVARLDVPSIEAGRKNFKVFSFP